jgi:hypothetical protein
MVSLLSPLLYSFRAKGPKICYSRVRYSTVALLLSFSHGGSKRTPNPLPKRLSVQAPSCGRQSCLQAAFQAAFSIRDEFLALRRFHAGGHEAGEMRANCVSGLWDGGLKGRLQARLPATQRGRAASCKRPAFSQIDARSRVPSGSETFWRYVGQVGNLRRVVNPPLCGVGQFILETAVRPIADRPQDAILPYIAGLEPQSAGCAKSSACEEYEG